MILIEWSKPTCKMIVNFFYPDIDNKSKRFLIKEKFITAKDVQRGYMSAGDVIHRHDHPVVFTFMDAINREIPITETMIGTNSFLVEYHGHGDYDKQETNRLPVKIDSHLETVFVSDIRAPEEFKMNTKEACLDDGDMKLGYVKASDLVNANYKVTKAMITDHSYIIEYLWKGGDGIAFRKEVKRLPVK